MRNCCAQAQGSDHTFFILGTSGVGLLRCRGVIFQIHEIKG
ncbi:Uncharacterized protein PPKH_1799 [Pseudomonas putida]|nr:Uncharacterized protein PPKH_1799 [Pseudomonas putida]